MKAKNLLLKLIPWLVIGLIAFFFYEALTRNATALKDIEISFNGLVVLAIFCFVISVVLSGVFWGKILNSLLIKTSVSSKEAIKIQSASWLLKYLPGQFGSVANKLVWAKQKGISQKTVTNSVIYDNVLLVLASLVVSAPVLALFQDKLGQKISLFLPLLIILPIIIIIYRPIFSWLLNFLFRKLNRQLFKDSDFLSTTQLLKFLGLYLIPRLTTGIGFVLMASSFLTVEPSMYIGLLSAYILATVVGLMAIFVPGGIGVREAVVVLLVSVYFPIEQAIVLSIITRFYATVSDIGVGLIYLALNKWRISYHD